VIFGKGLGTRYEDELVHPINGRPFHIFDGFALVNRLLCSAGPKGSSQGRPTPTMFRGCLEHFSATMSILEPTIVIMQGRGVEKSTREVFGRRRSYSDHLHEVRFSEQRLLLCTFSHPSARGALRWGDSLEAPYLNSVVVPTLKEAIRRL
jgi:uracil-DNA glycosylase